MKISISILFLALAISSVTARGNTYRCSVMQWDGHPLAGGITSIEVTENGVNLLERPLAPHSTTYSRPMIRLSFGDFRAGGVYTDSNNSLRAYVYEPNVFIVIDHIKHPLTGPCFLTE